ncbi:unnamed protein product [Closterium sp. NIES-53]
MKMEVDESAQAYLQRAETMLEEAAAIDLEIPESLFNTVILTDLTPEWENFHATHQALPQSMKTRAFILEALINEQQSRDLARNKQGDEALRATRALQPCASCSPARHARPAVLRAPRALQPCAPRAPCCPAALCALRALLPCSPVRPACPAALLPCAPRAPCSTARHARPVVLRALLPCCPVRPVRPVRPAALCTRICGPMHSPCPPPPPPPSPPSPCCTGGEAQGMWVVGDTTAANVATPPPLSLLNAAAAAGGGRLRGWCESSCSISHLPPPYPPPFSSLFLLRVQQLVGRGGVWGRKV